MRLVTGVRFYKSTANTGTHLGNLWSSERHTAGHGHVYRRDVVRLAASQLRHAGADHGRQRLHSFVLRPNGHYSVDRNYFDSQGVDNGPLHAVAQGSPAATACSSTAPAAFPPRPTRSNYWVDVVIDTSDRRRRPLPRRLPRSGSTDGGTRNRDEFFIDTIEFQRGNQSASSITTNSVELVNPDSSSDHRRLLLDAGWLV